MQYVKLVENTVQEIFLDNDQAFPNIPIEQRIPRAVLCSCIIVDDDTLVQPGWLLEGDVFVPPNYVPPPKTLAEFITEAKRRISGCCSAAIYQGTNVALERGTKHYAFVEKAQTDLGHMMNQIAVGILKFSYKADDEEYNLYTDIEIKAIYKVMTEWITINTAYYEKLQSWLDNIEATGTDADIELVKSIHYGSALPKAMADELITYLTSLDINVSKLLSLLS